MARRIPSLGRFVGAPSLYAMAYGEISSSLYYALGITAVYALSLTPVVFLAAGLLFALAAAAYAEGGATIPEPGGASAYARRAFNDLVGFIAGWATVLDFLIAISLSALFLPYYVEGALGQTDHLSSREHTGLAIAIVVVIALVRLWRRADVYVAGFVVSVLDLGVQVILAIVGLVLLFSWHKLSADVHLGVRPDWNSLAFSIPIAMVGYTGLEKVSNLAGAAKTPERSVPSSVRTSVFTVVLVYAAVATAAASAFPPHKAPGQPAGYASGLSTTYVHTPILGLVHAIGGHTSSVVESTVRVGVGVTACAILLMAITTGFSGCARLADAMGRNRLLPAAFAIRSRRTLVSPVTIVGVGLLSCGFLAVGAFFPGQEALTLASLYSFGILIAFMLTQASIIWLRIAEPDMPRPFTMRGNVRIRGRLIPLTSVVGAVLSFAAWVVALGTHPGARVVGPLWLIAGLVMYVVVRARAGLPLMERAADEGELPEDSVSLERGPIVVPLRRLDAIAEEMMATACRLASETGDRVIGVSGIAVDVRNPLDIPLPEREREVEEVQQMARSLAAEYGVEYEGRVGRTRNLGRMVVDAAVESDAAMIVVGAPEKRRLARNPQEELFGRTIDFVLRRAPCRVIVTHFPYGAQHEDAVPTG
jgi:APA family basic amino acid/polyamine antiporter